MTTTNVVSMLSNSVEGGVAVEVLEKQKKPKKKDKEKKTKKKRKNDDDRDDTMLSNDNNNENNSIEKKIMKKKSKKRIRSDNESSNHVVYDNTMPISINNDIDSTTENKNMKTKETSKSEPRPIVESSALPPHHQQQMDDVTSLEEQYPISLLLFYQYVTPLWNDITYKMVQDTIYTIGTSLHIHGRIRVAKEGLNCTLSGTRTNIIQFCHQLRIWKSYEFHQTEFKVTNHLQQKYHFPSLKIIPVMELVHYGLDGKSLSTVPTPDILEQYSGTHLEPIEYHKKLAEPNTVVIDVRNHYEATIGHFQLPTVSSPSQSSTSDGKSNDNNDTLPTSTSSKFLDPKMRKSTEFPLWLDNPETKEQLKGKQVLMYCTGGIRCERASSLLQYKIQNDPSMKELNIKGVYQLQGGIDKYFKQYPSGGYWVGKNYTFDKRCAHTPVEITATTTASGNQSDKIVSNDDSNGAHVSVNEPSSSTLLPLGKCAACYKAWDNYGGKPSRCYTCGVPNLICKECFMSAAEHKKKKKALKMIRCDLCVEQNVTSKIEYLKKEKQDIIEFEQRNQSLHVQDTITTKESNTNNHASSSTSDNDISSYITKYNPNGITRLFLRNMCRNNITEDDLLTVLPNITHIVWKTDGKTGTFYGQGWVEMYDTKSAAEAVQQSGTIIIHNRPLYIEYQPPDGKDLWPPPRSAIHKKKK